MHCITAIAIISNDNFIVQSSICRNNKALNGGAACIYAENTGMISDSNFTANIAFGKNVNFVDKRIDDDSYYSDEISSSNNLNRADINIYIIVVNCWPHVRHTYLILPLVLIVGFDSSDMRF